MATFSHLPSGKWRAQVRRAGLYRNATFAKRRRRLLLSDGSLIAVYLPLAELIERGDVIEAAPARSTDDECAEKRRRPFSRASRERGADRGLSRPRARC